jgi:microcystin-dependent protein
MLAVAAAASLSCGHALAASNASLPPKFPIPWGNSAGAPYIHSIPTTSQIGIVNCAASLADGWPPLTFVPAGIGGCPPFGTDFNGILNQITAWARWQAMGAAIPWDSTFSTAIGGYPLQATVPSAVTPNLWWQSTVDNNSSNPDTGGANWTGVGYAPTGAIIAFGGAAAPPGYLLCYGQAVSRTTYRALFAVIGTTYGVGDGSTTFNVPDLRGRTTYGPDAMGGTPANRITSAGGLFNAVLGASGGAQNQTLTQAQVPVFNLGTLSLNQATELPNGVQMNGSFGAGANIQVNTSFTPTVTIPAFGGGTSHPILSPGQIASYIIKN